MKWQGGRRSTNVEDRRGMRGGAIGGGGIGMILIVLVVSYLTGTNPLTLLQQVEQAGPGESQAVPTGAPTGDPAAEFLAVVLADTEDTWGRVFQAGGQRYEAPVLVLFEDSVQSACGSASAASGPFYCPSDQKVYLDLSFFRELDRRFGAPGDFAQAYVVAHEVGHHVQNCLASIGRSLKRNDRRAARKATPCPCNSSCRLTASQASGDITRSGSNYWTRATSKKAWPPPRPLAMTA